jgi:UDP-3-O-[3-hydroxymyristoyl] glucosamine N-acyltransferase
LVFTDNPRNAFVRCANSLEALHKQLNGSTIAPTAVIADSSRIGKNCSIGHFSIIGEDCEIGDNCIIHERVTIYRNCKIGENCVIQSGVTIGEDGFAYERLDDSVLEKFPHVKGVIIGNNVEIYANTNIARGSLTDTYIGDGTKIDGMVHIAHNVKIGKNCMLTAGTVIGGSAKIGDSCWTGLNCTIKNQVRIGSNVLVGAGACVINDIPEGEIVAGVPAKSIKHKTHTEKVFLMAGQRLERQQPSKT